MNGRVIDLPSFNVPGDPLNRAAVRINMLSEQVNYLLRELYKATNGQHGAFKRNTQLAEDTKNAIELELSQRSREVRVQEPTPEFTREQIKKLNAEQNK